MTLPEATPVYEAMRLEDDLKRAGLSANWWVINQSFALTGSSNRTLAVKADNEAEWINKVDCHTHGKTVLLPWHPEEVKGDNLLSL